MYIYLVKEEHGLTKIGYSSDIKQRFTSLRSGSPYEMELLHCKRILIAEEIENALHKLFKDKRKRGEWFDLDDKDIEKIHILLDYNEELIPAEDELKETLSKTLSDDRLETFSPPPFPGGLPIPEQLDDRITDVQKVAVQGSLRLKGLDWATLYCEATGKESPPPPIEDLTYQEAVIVIKYSNNIDRK